MKRTIRILFTICLLPGLLFWFASCNTDEGPQPTGDKEEYLLNPVSDNSVSGTVTFERRSDNAVIITIQLNGTDAGGMHPAHIHANNAAEGGSIVLDLNEVDGATGKSETIVAVFNDQTPLTYEGLIGYDGYVNVHMSSSDLGTLVAQGDIGQNELTADSEEYMLASVSDPAISGTVTFTKRVNNETLAMIELTGTTSGSMHPAHIHSNSAAQGGGIVINLNTVDGATGVSKTNITQTNAGDPLTYADLIAFDGYVNVHLSSTSLATLVAQGDVGQNELTGDSEEYVLGSVSDPAISGTVTFSKRVNNETLVVIELIGTAEGASHPAHIHNNSAEEGGGIAINLSNVNGTTGISKTNVTQTNAEVPLTYADMIAFDGYVNVHLSSDNLATAIARGNIGANAP